MTGESWFQGGFWPANTILTSYNEAGLVSSIVDNQASLSYQYDGLDRLTSETASYAWSGVATLGTIYSYNNKGQRQSTAFTVGSSTDRTENYGYDDLGRMIWQNRTGSGAQLRVEQDYDAADRMTAQRRFANSTGTGNPAVTTLYSYDDRNRQTNVTHRQGTATGTILQQFDYTFNSADWLTSEAKTIGGATNTDAYTYDAAGQIITATHTDRATESFSWDANGNPTGTGYVIGTNNRLLEDPTYTYAYDEEGNRISRTAKSGGATNTYTWDNRNRLVSADSTSEMYDPLDRRIGTSSGFTSTWFGYDGDHVMSAHQGSTITDRFTLGAGVDEAVGQEKNGSLRWLLTDGRGSVTGTTSSGGSSTGNKTYGTFGGTQSQAGTTDSFFAYTGREWDDAAGLQYSRNRWYDPSAKRWLSEDPIGFGGGDANLSRYVGNSPGSFSDPSGLIGTPLNPDGGYTGGGDYDQAERGQNNQLDDEFSPNTGEAYSGGADYDQGPPVKKQPPVPPVIPQRPGNSMNGGDDRHNDEAYREAMKDYHRKHEDYLIDKEIWDIEHEQKGFLTDGEETALTVVGFLPGGLGANLTVAANDWQKGDYFAAALGGASVLPLVGYGFAAVNKW